MVAGLAPGCARGMCYGGVVLHSHTQVRLTFPFVQFKPLGVGERNRSVLSGADCRLDSGSQHCIVQADKPGRRKQVARRIRNPSAWMRMLDGASALSV